MTALGYSASKVRPASTNGPTARLDAEYRRLLDQALQAVVRMEFHEVDHLKLLKCLRPSSVSGPSDYERRASQEQLGR